MAVKDYESPTTPGLMVTFRAYVVERVCLNLRPDLGPRFWKDRKHWQPKFVRESVALSRLLKHFDENDPVVRRAVIEIVDERRMRTLMTRNQSRDVKRVRAKHRELVAQRQALAAAASEPVRDLEDYVDTSKKTSGNSSSQWKARTCCASTCCIALANHGSFASLRKAPGRWRVWSASWYCSGVMAWPSGAKKVEHQRSPTAWNISHKGWKVRR